jgi:hypothetical protein
MRIFEMEQRSAIVGLDAFIVRPEPPRRDARLTLELLDVIARATEGGQPVRSSEFETLRGWTPEQVWRELRLVWDEELIRCTNTKELSDPAGKTSLLIHDLTPAGWKRLDDLNQRYRRRARWVLKQSWPAAERWILAPVVQVGVTVCAAALLAWLTLG